MPLRERVRSLARRLSDPILRPVARRIGALLAASNEVAHRVAPAGVELGANSLIYPGARLDNLSRKGQTIRIGSGCHIRGEIVTYWNAGEVSIGDHCYVGAGTRIWSQARISIGNHVLVSHLVDIHDSDAHPLDPTARRTDIAAIFAGGYHAPTITRSAPVVIEDDVWICLKATILKGVRIGRGAVVAAGAVVTSDVPAMTIVAGNPARVVSRISER